MSDSIVYFLGAGASRHVHCNTPLVNDFFEKCASYVEEPPVWVALMVLEWHRVFENRVPELENFSAAIRLTKGEEQSKLVKLYAEKFRQSEERRRENLESVFVKAEQRKEAGEDEPFQRLAFLINFIFSRLDQEMPHGEAYEKLASVLKEDLEASPNLTHVVVSYNYDLWLEKSLFKHGIWGPTWGYGGPVKWCVKPLDSDEHAPMVEIVEQSLSDSQVFENRVLVLKPHGSLSWCGSRKDPSRLALMLENATDNSNVKYNEKYWFTAIKTGGEITKPTTLEPLIVPPVPSKRRSHPFFWETDQRLQRCLNQARTVVVIGWSLPEADIEQRGMIEHEIRHRYNQVEDLVVCDLDQSQRHYAKFETLFRPKNGIDRWNEGFTSAFVQHFRERYLHGVAESAQVVPPS